jgi:hypothetical protein
MTRDRLLIMSLHLLYVDAFFYIAYGKFLLTTLALGGVLRLKDLHIKASCTHKDGFHHDEHLDYSVFAGE